jgi:predicted transcriptional regulator
MKSTLNPISYEIASLRSITTPHFSGLLRVRQILSGQNQRLLRQIKESHPASLSELETISGRKKSNLSRSLKTLSNCGIVDLIREKGTVRPVVNATDFQVELSI